MSRDEITLTVTIKVPIAAWAAEYGCDATPQAIRDDAWKWLRGTLASSPCPLTNVTCRSHIRTPGIMPRP